MTGNLQNQLLDLIMEMHSLDSDYKLAKHLAVPLQSIRNYRLNKSKMDDTMCLQVAEALKMEPLQVMARVRLDGSENARTRRVWGSYLGRLFLVAVVAQAQPIDSFAQNDGQRTLTNIHYTHYFARFCARLARLIGLYCEQKKRVWQKGKFAPVKVH